MCQRPPMVQWLMCRSFCTYSGCAVQVEYRSIVPYSEHQRCASHHPCACRAMLRAGLGTMTIRAAFHSAAVCDHETLIFPSINLGDIGIKRTCVGAECCPPSSIFTLGTRGARRQAIRADSFSRAFSCRGRSNIRMRYGRSR